MKSDSNVTRRQIPRRYLRRVPSLALLKSKDLDWVQQRLQWRQYATDETILRRGVHNDFLGIIEAGQVNVIFQTPGGRHRTVTMQSGDFFTLHNGVPSSATIRAVTSVALWTLSPADTIGLGQRLPSTPQFSTARLPKFWLPTTWLTIPFNTLRQRPHLARFGLAVVAILLIWAVITSPKGQNLLADLHYARGCQYLEQGRSDAALQEFETTLEMNPAHAASHADHALPHTRQHLPNSTSHGRLLTGGEVLCASAAVRGPLGCGWRRPSIVAPATQTRAVAARLLPSIITDKVF